jgi:hypothetical protein
MTPSEAHFFVYAKDRILFEERKHEYELMRKQTYYLLQPYGSQKKPIPRPDRLMPFSWDKQIKINLEDFSEARFAALEERYLGKKATPFIQAKIVK